MSPRWLLMLLLLAIQACSSTPFGQKLADSFDSPPTPAAVQEKSNPGEQEKTTTALNEPTPPSGDQLTSNKEEEETKGSEPTTSQPTKTEAVPARPIPAEPRPYRITIRLAAADPAAPAEGVTDALRRAGIGFEVETIEKISSSKAAKETTKGTSVQP